MADAVVADTRPGDVRRRVVADEEVEVPGRWLACAKVTSSVAPDLRLGSCRGIIRALPGAPTPSACSSWQSRQPALAPAGLWANLVWWQGGRSSAADVPKLEAAGSGVAASMREARASV